MFYLKGETKSRNERDIINSRPASKTRQRYAQENIERSSKGGIRATSSNWSTTDRR